MFSSCLPTVERYAALLATIGIDRGLIGPREVPRLWDRHLLNSGLLAGALTQGGEVADVGSGAGLPGLVLAIARPDCRVVLVEPLLRRSVFLTETVDELGLENVEVVRARAEELHGHRTFAVVTARAVAALDKLARWTLPLVAPGGDLVAMKGSSAQREVDDARSTIRRLGGEVVGLEQYGDAAEVSPITVVRVHVPAAPSAARRGTEN